MSRYMVDKLIRQIEMSDRNVAAYVTDPEAYVEEWERRGSLTRAPGPDGGRLTAEERAAFVARDYGELYRLGAHPYLLWHFVEAVYIHEVPWPELNTRYREAVRRLGEPDFIT